MPDAAIAPSVCVIIAAYNSAATIERAVRSALAEPETGEVIVIDDASTDDTAAQARRADDGSNRLRVFIQPHNAGPSAARNRALAECRFPWIAILDADDYFLLGRLHGLLSFAADADMVADDMWQEDVGGGPRRQLLGDAVSLPMSVDFDSFISANMSGQKPGRERYELGFIKPVMRHSFLAERGIAYQEHMRLGEDYELYARALAHGARLLLVPAQGYVAVVRPNSLSGQHSELDLQNLRDCDAALGEIAGLPDASRKLLRRHYLNTDCRLQWRLLINAVKARDIAACLACFMRPHPVPVYLLGKLLEQLYLRFPRPWR